MYKGVGFGLLIFSHFYFIFIAYLKTGGGGGGEFQANPPERPLHLPLVGMRLFILHDLRQYNKTCISLIIRCTRDQYCFVLYNI